MRRMTSKSFLKPVCWRPASIQKRNTSMIAPPRRPGSIRGCLRAGFHIHPRLRRLDNLGAAPMPISGLPAREWGDVGRQDLGPDRDGDRAVRGTGRARAGTPAGRDRACAGHPAPVPARGHAVAQPGGTPWRSLVASPGQASGSTLRRRLAGWAQVNLLQRVPALRVAMLRGHPDLILDSCSVRAKRGGDLTGPNPTDRGKRGTKYHIATRGDGVPVACAATAANVNDTLLFERLFLTAFAVVAKIGTVFADKGYDAEPHRELCRAFGAEPCLHKR